MFSCLVGSSLPYINIANTFNYSCLWHDAAKLAHLQALLIYKQFHFLLCLKTPLRQACTNTLVIRPKNLNASLILPIFILSTLFKTSCLEIGNLTKENKLLALLKQYEVYEKTINSAQFSFNININVI